MDWETVEFVQCVHIHYKLQTSNKLFKTDYEDQNVDLNKNVSLLKDIRSIGVAQALLRGSDLPSKMHSHHHNHCRLFVLIFI